MNIAIGIKINTQATNPKIKLIIIILFYPLFYLNGIVTAIVLSSSIHTGLCTVISAFLSVYNIKPSLVEVLSSLNR
jgi:hypothetical protein